MAILRLGNLNPYSYYYYYYYFPYFNYLFQMELANYLYEKLHSIPNVHVYGPVPSETVPRAALCSFNVENIHPTDIATFLDQQVRLQTHLG